VAWKQIDLNLPSTDLFSCFPIHGILISVHKCEKSLPQINVPIFAKAVLIYVSLSQSQPCTPLSGTVFSYYIKSNWCRELSRGRCSAGEKMDVPPLTFRKCLSTVQHICLQLSLSSFHPVLFFVKSSALFNSTALTCYSLHL